jgi:hypothetical protein
MDAALANSISSIRRLTVFGTKQARLVALESMAWEETFEAWAKPPGVTEETKCENAERAVRKAIEASAKLQHYNIKVFTQGSYRNRTNVRIESDVDICVLCTNIYFTDFSMVEGLTDASVGLVNCPYTYAEFRNDVGDALRAQFGASFVARGNKAFDVHENTYRVDADVVACFTHRRYHKNVLGDVGFIEGAELRADNGGRVTNWPEQGYQNGVEKNDATSRRFKAVVRILKRLRNYMSEKGVAIADDFPSFLIECLVWNVPNEGLGHSTRTADVRFALAHIFNSTLAIDKCSEWGEINELKYLFRAGQPWTLVQAHAFASAAWDFLGFE